MTIVKKYKMVLYILSLVIYISTRGFFSYYIINKTHLQLILKMMTQHGGVKKTVNSIVKMEIRSGCKHKYCCISNFLLSTWYFYKVLIAVSIYSIGSYSSQASVGGQIYDNKRNGTCSWKKKWCQFEGCIFFIASMSLIDT